MRGVALLRAIGVAAVRKAAVAKAERVMRVMAPIQAPTGCVNGCFPPSRGGLTRPCLTHGLAEGLRA